MSLGLADVPDPDAALDDDALAAALASDAGRLLLRLRAELMESGAGSRTVKDAGDGAAQQQLARQLHLTRPADAILSEEAGDDLSRLDADRVWIIDPLDGTREFSEAGRDDWAVHVALWQDGDLTAGAVCRPATGRTFATPAPGHHRADPDGRLRLAVSRTRPSPLAVAVGRRLGAELVPMGSAGAKSTAILEGGGVDVYLHTGGQYEWDSAAPVAVARAAGLHTSRADGRPLQYNRPDPWLPDLLICPRWAADRVLDAVASAGGLP